MRRNPQFESAHYYLAVVYAEMGRLEDAAWELEEILVLRPDYSISIATERSSYGPEDLERIRAGLRLAGLPE